MNIYYDAIVILMTHTFSVPEFLQMFTEFIKILDPTSECKLNLQEFSQLIDALCQYLGKQRMSKLFKSMGINVSYF